jgi:hypothetical protein
MKKNLVAVFVFLMMGYTGIAQKINGQWRGYFNSKGDIVLSGGDNTEYVLEIEINGSDITGYSYTYFQDRKYYVICSLAGIYYKSTKSMKVTETAKVKGSTPFGWSDCLQTHILTYEKNDDVEEMKGTWRTAPGQTGNCGTGTTTLTRRTLSKNLASFNKPKTNAPFTSPVTAKKLPDLSDKNKKTVVPLTIVKTKPVTKQSKPVTKGSVKKDTGIKPPPIVKTTPEKIIPEVKKQTEIIPVMPAINFEKRSTEVLKTIEITGENFKVNLYDNGTVDGDSISLFYNGKLILSHKMLSEKPITLTLDATTDHNINELTMYADNLGTIPPNTALMVVTDGDNRYEVRISSDLKKSGTIRFVHKAKEQ